MDSKHIVRAFVSPVLFSIILFLCAGRLDYLEGWFYWCTNLLASLMHIIALRGSPDLAMERSKPGEGIKPWDKAILGLSAIALVVNIVLGGLDSGRFHWSPPLPWSVPLAGTFLTLAGQVIFLAAQRENKYFSSVMRIQKDRGHVVCTTGPYRIVRHPGYVGMIVSLIGIPMLLGSLVSIVPTVIAIVLLLIRTHLEDNALKNELDGYLQYAETTRYKLIPGIW